jgi:hypothetical protein
MTVEDIDGHRFRMSSEGGGNHPDDHAESEEP